MKLLVVIPARGGSKGLPGKNIKSLRGKPLIEYSIDIARQVTDDRNICVSTDDMEIIHVVEKCKLKVPFVRPAELATDTATTNDVLLHALDFYKDRGIIYDVILLLQTTSPLRTIEQVREAMELYDDVYDMVVSVKESHVAAVMCHETSEGFLAPTLTNASRRQDAPVFYEYNGAIYFINVKSLYEKGLSGFDRQKKYVMPVENSIDIDNQLDFELCELLMST